MPGSNAEPRAARPRALAEDGRRGAAHRVLGNPHIHAVGDIRVESHPGRKDRVRLFYGELVGLRELPAAGEPEQLVFEAHGRRLVVALSEQAVPSPVRRRVVIEVDSLFKLWQRLTEHRIWCMTVSGMGVGDRRLVALDPADNRVEFKEVWLL